MPSWPGIPTFRSTKLSSVLRRHLLISRRPSLRLLRWSRINTARSRKTCGSQATGGGPLNRYVWVTGAWRRPPPDQVWSPGSWNLAEGRYTWAPGYWGPHGYSRVSIDLAPHPLRVEVRPAPPSVGFVWTPGYYDYRGANYVWVGGSYARPPTVGLGWVEPRYVTVGGHYTFQPGRWDFAPERRGVVYRPDINVHAGRPLRSGADASRGRRGACELRHRSRTLHRSGRSSNGQRRLHRGA